MFPPRFVIVWETSGFCFPIEKPFAFSLQRTLALSLYVFLVHISGIDTWNCVCFTGSVSLMVLLAEGSSAGYLLCSLAELGSINPWQLRGSPPHLRVRETSRGSSNPAWAQLRGVWGGSAPLGRVLTWSRPGSLPGSTHSIPELRIYPGPGLAFLGVLCDQREESTL